MGTLMRQVPTTMPPEECRLPAEDTAARTGPGSTGAFLVESPVSPDASLGNRFGGTTGFGMINGETVPKDRL